VLELTTHYTVVCEQKFCMHIAGESESGKEIGSWRGGNSGDCNQTRKHVQAGKGMIMK